MPCTPRPDERRSPRIPGPEALHGKVGEEIRRLPVSDAGNNQIIDIFQHLLERLALRGRFCRQGFADLARFDLRQHGKRFDVRLIVGDPVDLRRGRGDGIHRASCEKIFRRALATSENEHRADRTRVDFKSQPRCPKYRRVLYSKATRFATAHWSKMIRNSRSIGLVLRMAWSWRIRG